MPREVGGEEKNSDRNGNSGGRESDFDVALAGDNDEKLNGETDEEEEIKLEKRDVDLQGMLAILLGYCQGRKRSIPGSEGIASSCDSRLQYA